MCKVLLFVDMEFPRGRGEPNGKIIEIPGGGGSTMKPLGTENPGGWGSNLKKPSVGGYGYFLEPHTDEKRLEKTKSPVCKPSYLFL